MTSSVSNKITLPNELPFRFLNTLPNEVPFRFLKEITLDISEGRTLGEGTTVYKVTLLNSCIH